jgi:hypothetical protein
MARVLPTARRIVGTPAGQVLDRCRSCCVALTPSRPNRRAYSSLLSSIYGVTLPAETSTPPDLVQLPPAPNTMLAPTGPAPCSARSLRRSSRNSQSGAISRGMSALMGMARDQNAVYRVQPQCRTDRARAPRLAGRAVGKRAGRGARRRRAGRPIAIVAQPQAGDQAALRDRLRAGARVSRPQRFRSLHRRERWAW